MKARLEYQSSHNSATQKAKMKYNDEGLILFIVACYSYHEDKTSTPRQPRLFHCPGVWWCSKIMKNTYPSSRPRYSYHQGPWKANLVYHGSHVCSTTRMLRLQYKNDALKLKVPAIFQLYFRTKGATVMANSLEKSIIPAPWKIYGNYVCSTTPGEVIARKWWRGLYIVSPIIQLFS